jgi:ankyrin repeat protein
MRKVFILVALLVFVSAVFAGEIHEAAKIGDLKTVKALLDSNPELIKATNETGATPLHSATYNGQTAMAEYLLSAGADINALTSQGSVPLHGAAFYGHIEAAKLLIAKGANVNIANRYGYVPLLSAAAGGNIEIVKSLIEAGADTAARISDGGLNALQLAVFTGHLQLVEFLLSKGFDINQTTDNGENFLHAAVSTDSIALVKFGIDHGIDPNQQSRSGETPLHSAVWSTFQQGMTPAKGEVIKLLLASGADINRKDMSGETPLSRAASTRNSEIVNLLIDAGADINNLNNDNVTPLVIAIHQGYLDNVRSLLQKGALSDTKDNHYGMTPLHQAVIVGNVELVKTLLDYVRDINAADNDGKSPLDYARRYGHKQITDLLISAGGKSNGTDNNIGTLAGLKNSPEEGTAQLWYLGHCGWAIRTKNHFMIFDYFPGVALPTDLSLLNGNINPTEIQDLNVEVFVSHDHRDHYDSTIYGWQSSAKNLTYIFGFKPEELPETQRQGYDGRAYEYFGPRETRTIDGMTINTIRSNDGGVGFLVEADGMKIFHAGDHAGWENGNSAPFTSEIDYLANLTGNVDLAFINTTGCRFSRDTLALEQSVIYAIEKLSPKATIPTHGIGREYVYRDYARKIHNKGCKTDVLCAEFKGDNFEFIRKDSAL